MQASGSNRGAWMVKAAGLGLLALSLAGCDVVSVVGDVASSAMGASKEIVTAGKTDTVVPLAWEDTLQAARKAASKLALTPIKEQAHPDQRKLIYHDDRDQEVNITVIRRTAEMTEIHVDVGMFGAKGVGELVLAQTLRELPGTPEYDRANTDKD